MGKPKEKKPLTLPAASAVPAAAPLVEAVARAKSRLAKVREVLATDGAVDKFHPKHRAAKKRVKRAQRRLRERLRYVASRQKPAAAAGETPAAS